VAQQTQISKWIGINDVIILRAEDAPPAPDPIAIINSAGSLQPTPIFEK